MEIVMSLVFSSVLLIFMIYPAMKIVEFLETKMDISERAYNILTIVLTVVLSLVIGIALYFI